MSFPIHSMVILQFGMFIYQRVNHHVPMVFYGFPVIFYGFLWSTKLSIQFVAQISDESREIGD